MDIVPVTQEEDFTPNKVEMVGDEDKTIIQEQEDLPESTVTNQPDKGTSSPTEDNAKPNQNDKEEVVNPDDMQNNTDGAVEPSVTMD